MINQLITRFNDVIDSLIKDFSEFNLDEDALAFLAKKIRNFITFNELSLTNILFAVLKNVNDVAYDYEDKINETKEMIKVIFEKLNKAVDHILEHDDEEHSHGHDHDHSHHHIHVDVDEVQDDIDLIVKSLKFLKKLFDNLFNIVLATLKYQANTIEKQLYDNEYNKFNENIENLKSEFKKVFQ